MSAVDCHLQHCMRQSDLPGRISCALFPQVAPGFIKRRDNVDVHGIIVEWSGE